MGSFGYPFLFIIYIKAISFEITYLEYIMSQRPVEIPEVVVGADVETKSTAPNAYMLSFACVAFDIRTLTQVANIYRTIDPNDENMVEPYFHTDESTLKWWRGDVDPQYAPDPAAYKEAFSGTTKLPDALKDIVDFLEPIRKKQKHVVSSRGPEFDIPIIRNALRQCDLYEGIFRRFSNNDSDRTAERVLAALGMEIEYVNEKHHWCNLHEWVEHMPAFDAGRTAYRTARMYHLLYLIRTHGSDTAYKANEEMRRGSYDAKKFLANLGDV